MGPRRDHARIEPRRPLGHQTLDHVGQPSRRRPARRVARLSDERSEQVTAVGIPLDHAFSVDVGRKAQEGANRHGIKAPAPRGGGGTAGEGRQTLPRRLETKKRGAALGPPVGVLEPRVLHGNVQRCRVMGGAPHRLLDAAREEHRDLQRVVRVRRLDQCALVMRARQRENSGHGVSYVATRGGFRRGR